MDGVCVSTFEIRGLLDAPLCARDKFRQKNNREKLCTFFVSYTMLKKNYFEKLGILTQSLNITDTFQEDFDNFRTEYVLRFITFRDFSGISINILFFSKFYSSVIISRSMCTFFILNVFYSIRFKI